MPKFAANLSMMFTEVDFLDRFKIAAGSGFKGVEYLFPYAFSAADIKARLDEHGLVQVLFNMPPGDWDAGERGIAALPGREGEFRDGVEKALEYAAALGCDQVHAMSGLLPEGGDAAKALDTYLENLTYAAKACADKGIRLLIEPINTRDMPGYFMSSVALALDVIAKVGSDNLFLQYDIYHAQMTDGFLAETMRANMGLIRHMQLAGVPGRHEPNVGEINYPYLFDLMDSLGYEGWIGCEYKPKGVTTDGLAWGRDYGINRPRVFQ